MALELRPGWCLDDDIVRDLLDLGEWTTDSGTQALDRDGDHWKPGDPVRIHRQVSLRVDPVEVRRQLGLRPGAVIGVACRWTCRTTSEAGTHVGGPAALPLVGDVAITLEVPSQIAGSLELETCLLVRWSTEHRPPNACPDGAMVWSEGWSVGRAERSLLLEGSEVRVPVRSVAFASYFGQPSGALWSIDLDPSVAMDDLLCNVVTVLLNREVLDRDFKDREGEGDASLLSRAAAAGIQVDLLRALSAALVEELEGDEDWREMEDGTVGAMVVRHLTETFESVQGGLANFSDDQPAFARELWHRFAPTTWSA